MVNFEDTKEKLFGGKTLNREDLLRELFDHMNDRLKDKDFKIRRLEDLVNNCYEMCLCERAVTKGFDYGESHKREGSPQAGARFNTPRDIIEVVVGFKWKYKDKTKPGNSWKELQFEHNINKKPGFY